MKTSEKSRVRNKSVRTAIATARKKLMEAIGGGQLDQSRKALSAYSSALDKAVKKGILNRNAARRRKARAAVHMKSLA